MKHRAISRCVLFGVVSAALFATGCTRTPAAIGRVEIVGDVETPGFYDIREGQTAAAVVEKAGEVAEQHARFVFLYHTGDREPHQTMPLANFRAHGHEIELLPDDTVIFSRVAKPQVYMSADSETAKALLWTPNMTLNDALQAADIMGHAFLRTGIRVCPYGDKGVGRPGRGAEKLLPGDTVSIYDLYQATIPKRQWIEKRPRKSSIIIGPGNQLIGVDQLNRQ